jgi:hypothetical protein
MGAADQAVYQTLEAELNTLISAETIRYSPLRYEYTEGLLKSLDRIDRMVSGTSADDAPRLLPGLDPAEELSHLKETVRHWEAKTGKKLRAEVDSLQADVAARKPGEAFHPEFQRKFSTTFDDFIAVEVADLRERRNRTIHTSAGKLFDPFRASNPEAVRRASALIETPQYSPPTAPTASPPGRG